MGGFGSGKSYGIGRVKRSRRFCTSDLSKFKVSELIRDHKKSLKSIFVISSDEYEFSLNIVFGRDDLIYISGETGITISNIIKIATFPCHFGGFRYFAHCPACNRKVSNLYLYRNQNQPVLACRKCLKMYYQNQNATLSNRLYWRSKIVKEKIDSDPYRKPKWMRKKTFAKLRDDYFDFDDMSSIADLMSLRNTESVRIIKEMYGDAACIPIEVVLTHSGKNWRHAEYKNTDDLWNGIENRSGGRLHRGNCF